MAFPKMTNTAGRRVSLAVGAITGLAGCALAAVPAHAGPLMGLAEPRDARLIGLADLALVPGLLLGRPRWPWLAARAALNVPMAAYVLHRGGKGPRARNARAFALTVTTATIGDLNAALALLHD